MLAKFPAIRYLDFYDKAYYTLVGQTVLFCTSARMTIYCITSMVWTMTLDKPVRVLHFSKQCWGNESTKVRNPGWCSCKDKDLKTVKDAKTLEGLTLDQYP